MAASPGPTPGRSSPTTGSGGRSVAPNSGGRPAARRARDDRMASAPAMTVTERVPALMSLAARLTSHWGLLPPTVVDSQAPGRAPIRPANSPARAGPDRVMTSTTDSRSMRSRRPGAAGKGLLAGPGHQVDRRDQLGSLDGLAGRHHHRDALGVVGGGGHRREVDTLVSGRKLPSPSGTHRSGSPELLSGHRALEAGLRSGHALGIAAAATRSQPHAAATPISHTHATHTHQDSNFERW